MRDRSLLAAFTLHGTSTCSCMHLHPSFLIFSLVRKARRNSNGTLRVKAAYATSVTFDQTRLSITRYMCGIVQSLVLVWLPWVHWTMYIMQRVIRHSTCSSILLSKLQFIYLFFTYNLILRFRGLLIYYLNEKDSPDVYSYISSST